MTQNNEQNEPISFSCVRVSPRARRLAQNEALSLMAPMLAGTGPGGRIIERDVMAALTKRPALTAAAKAVGFTLACGQAAGSGIGGRVTLEDLTKMPVKGIDNAISGRTPESLAGYAHHTLNASAPVTKLQEICSAIKASEDLSEKLGLAKISMNDIILFIVSRLLLRYPLVFEQADPGIAVDTPQGFMTPVIHNAGQLSPMQISAEAKRLSSACREGSIKPEELSGSAFSVVDLGNQGITGFAPVLNRYEAVVLGVYGIEMKPIAPPPADEYKSNVRFEPHIGFNLTINNQLVDSAAAARFLKALCNAVADIDLFLAAR
ncbi:MAG: 2-oxo acid dehydrogenase subunit E2 [Treponema sp.]|jgi:pyruvate dehydrogenase E2 component (dihydrolipoamide acetyltransferase)|nr:2-oxo acid dehydrogenase subunit E2 [Treponema sp.]